MIRINIKHWTKVQNRPLILTHKKNKNGRTEKEKIAQKISIFFTSIVYLDFRHLRRMLHTQYTLKNRSKDKNVYYFLVWKNHWTKYKMIRIIISFSRTWLDKNTKYKFQVRNHLFYIWMRSPLYLAYKSTVLTKSPCSPLFFWVLWSALSKRYNDDFLN